MSCVSLKYGSKVAGAIRTKDDLWEWARQKDVVAKHPLGRLSDDALEKFINGVEFFDYVKDGQRYQHVGGWDYGDLLNEHGLSHRDLFDVFALFGVSAEYGTWRVDEKVDTSQGHCCVFWTAYVCHGC